MDQYVLGVDFGTSSCRAMLVNASNGEEYDTEVSYYPRYEQEKYCNPKLSQYRHHPQDYIEALKAAVRPIIERSEKSVFDNIVALSADSTGSTPCAVNEEGVPLALLPEFAETPDAMFILWKDHTALKEAEEITKTAKTWGGIDYTKYCGGSYSAEWFFAKILHIMRGNRRVARAAYSWVELCDWIPALLTGVTKAEDIIRSRCAAGHKALWNEEFGGLPPNDFFVAVDPLLDGLTERLFKETYTADKCVGVISEEWARELGLPSDVKIGGGAFDAHMGAVGANIRPKSIVRIMGTSTCDVMVADYESIGDMLVEGICGQVDGSVLPGMIGLEAGQSAFGDVYAWFREVLMWPSKILPVNKLSDSDKGAIKRTILQGLEREAEMIEPDLSGVLALDWHNGRRTPFMNQNLKGAIIGITLGTDAPQIMRSLIEATAFGTKAIVNRFVDCGLVVNEIIAIGGIPKISALTMQICANVLNMPVKVCKSEQCVALGAAIYAAVVGGVYPDVRVAQRKMASSFESIYFPNEEQAKLYEAIYERYVKLGNFIEKSLDS